MPELDDGSQGNESVNDSVFEAIAEQNHELYTSQGRKDRAENDPAKTGKEGATSDHTKTQLEKQEKKNQANDEDDPADNADGLDSQDFSHEIPTADEDAEDVEPVAEVAPLQSDPVDENDNWHESLPAAPPEFAIEPPKPDEFGQIDPQDYTTYVVEKAKHDMRQEAYVQLTESRALDAAEKILPELKTNPAIRQLVENARVASILNGTSISTYDAAKQIKEALGISPAKIAEAETKGANNAKVSITVQKNASVEKQGATKKKVENTKKTNLDRRLKAGDSSAFEELMGEWLETGKV